MESHTRRKLLLQALIKPHRKITVFAERHGLNESYISQILNDKRKMGEKAARNMEEQIGLPSGYFEQPLPDESDAEGHAAFMSRLFELARQVPRDKRQSVLDMVGYLAGGADSRQEQKAENGKGPPRLEVRSRPA